MKSVFIDFQVLPEQFFSNEEDFLIELCLLIGDALEISEAIDQYWSGRRAPILNCNRYLTDYILPQIGQSFILAMDEVDRMFDSPFRANFFGMLRTWYNQRIYHKDFEKMTLFLSSSTEPFLFENNPYQSPFNIAQPILLQDFAPQEVNELNKRYNFPLSSEQISDLMNLVGGHPYLINRAFSLLATGQYDMGTLLAEGVEDKGPFGNHLGNYLLRVLQQTDLRQALTHICREHRYGKNQVFYRLEGAGLIKVVDEKVVLRNNLYARYFEKHLVD